MATKNEPKKLPRSGNKQSSTSVPKKANVSEPQYRQRQNNESKKRSRSGNKQSRITGGSPKKAKVSEPQYRQRRHADVVSQGKEIWNQLRLKSNTAQQTRALMDRLMPLITTKCSELALQHDASRVVQAAIQFGTMDERILILKELCHQADASMSNTLLELCKSQYAHFVVLKVIKYCHTKQECVDLIVKAFKGHMTKLGVHAVASRAVEAMFQTLAAKHTAVLKQEFYGPHFSLFVTDTLKQQSSKIPTLSSNLKAAPDKKDQTLEFVRTLVSKGMEKNLYAYGYFQTLFAEYLQEAPGDDIRVMAGTAADHTIRLLSSRDGSRVAAQLAAYGTAKDRKRMLKSIKGYCRSGLLHADAYLAIIRLVQLTDDTVSIHKNLLNEILTTKDEASKETSPLLELALSDTAAKLFLYLIPESATQRDKYFDPYELSVLTPNPTVKEDGQQVPTSKKDPELRRQEVLQHLQGSLIDMCVNHTERLLRSLPGGNVLREVYATFHPEALTEALVHVCLDALSTKTQGEELPLFEDRTFHSNIKKLVLRDADGGQEGKRFAVEFFATLTSDTNARVMEVLQSNRGAFVMVALSSVPSIQKQVIKELKHHKSKLEQLANGEGTTAGFKALVKVIST